MSQSRHNRRTGGQGQALVPSGTKKALPQVYLKGGKKILPDIYMTDHGTHRGSMFKWMVSTMFAGLFGVGAIGTVIYASVKSEKADGSSGIVSHLRQIGAKAMTPFKPLLIDRQRGPRFVGTKSDRLLVTSKGLSTRLIIHDTFSRRRDNRDYLTIKPYARIVASLATAHPEDKSRIPAFDPFKLYANTKPIGNKKTGNPGRSVNHANVRSLPLALSIAPEDDPYSYPDHRATMLVAIAGEDLFAATALTESQGEDGVGARADNGLPPGMNGIGQNTTTVVRTLSTHVQEEQEQTEQVEVTVRSGDTINALLRNAGAENWQSAQIITAMNNVHPASAIKTGQKMRYIAVPKPGDAGKSEPVKIALFNRDRHLVTVTRNEAGDYVASKNPGVLKYQGRKTSYPRQATLYQSFYHSGLLQKLPGDTILKLLRIHAYDTDFKRRTQAGDTFEAFFDTRQDKQNYENIPNELLYTSITVNGEKRAYYRFRTPDGTIDYYDRNGNSAKKFLMRKPVRGNRVRLASGFGWRRHPILKKRRMHTGTDWAGPTGTPILAAGNGIVEKAGRKGSYGNYVRIRHANGYKSAYAHMHRFAKGMKAGIKVRQGQVIGYIGTTGRSTGPHLHFEVLVNNKFVNAMTIPVPRGLRLKGHLASQFAKERDRIDELMSRDPVTTQVASVN